jgi:hypothetical protein
MDDEYGGFAFVQDVLCSMQDKLAIPKSWILLDSQCKVSTNTTLQCGQGYSDLNNVQKKYKVTYDSSENTGFIVHKTDSTNRVFMPSKKGLFFSDVKGDTVHVQVNTVEKNKNKYMVKKYSDAVFWLNCFPHKNGVHATLCPGAIVTGSHIDYKKHCCPQFG